MHSSTTFGSYQIARFRSCLGSDGRIDRNPDVLIEVGGGCEICRFGAACSAYQAARPLTITPTLAAIAHFCAANAKTPAFSGGGFWLREPDDYLLSHGNPHYHRR
ncbi:hypothetical protein, partial [Burkholderia sp. Bp8991]|uniref:hypothetical protein n=1 Tax=Burkholderia sp. Bp8991 TaxID=2184553 RepID=UPI001C8A14C1